RRHVVGANLQMHDAAGGDVQQLVQHSTADATALVRRIDTDGVDFVFEGGRTTQPRDAAVADQCVVIACGHIVIVIGGELSHESGCRPGVVAGKQQPLQPGAAFGVASGKPVEGHIPGPAACRSASVLASGRLRYSGTSGAGACDQSATAATKPAASGYAGSMHGSPKRDAGSGQPG